MGGWGEAESREGDGAYNWTHAYPSLETSQIPSIGQFVFLQNTPLNAKTVSWTISEFL